MLSDFFNCYKSPIEIASTVNWFTKDGLIIWNNLKFDKMKFVWRDYKRVDMSIQDALKNPNQAIMLQVNDGAHWVVALRKTWFGNSYIVADPWTGKECDVIKVYKNITGSALFERK